ncbi:DUF4333 domain-containing protein [Streptomyces sp. NPDC102274]|uniref:DUF4333 domain-containing protein n=1 Tax=Streptomyces sp. NPDC102274 TaxID=3366151 RepID=UPI0037F52CF4
MTEQGKFARSVVGLSAVVIAVCAVVVTVNVVNAQPPRLLDQEAVERQVAATVRGGSDMSRDGVFCPTAMEAKKGNVFECSVAVGGGGTDFAKVEVVDDQGKLSMDKY